VGVEFVCQGEIAGADAESRPAWNSARVMYSGFGGDLRGRNFLARATMPAMRAVARVAVVVDGGIEFKI
jgi:hypothetical protein